ncbi:class I SAM-dependent methyltransferase [Kangiella sp. TOML190]|uniref:class I SAM-dependent methyltransferase n=1 Tax=Kangiella sp. TOML190 TaxID=2931351 RepID=UPI0035DEA8B6
MADPIEHHEVSSELESATWKSNISQAMKSEIRDEKDTKRDANRKPIQTLEFFGFADDMSVIELIPGAGWYTKLLAPALAERGQYYGALFTRRIEENLKDKAGFEKIKVLSVEAKTSRDQETRLSSIEPFEFEVEPVDMVLTFRNYHNFDKAGRMNINKAAFKALKSGGIYGVIDHTRRHMTPFSSEQRRRIDPVLAIKEIQAAGFVLVDYSNLHYRPQDDLTQEVGHESVTGQTDRWTLKFRKP